MSIEKHNAADALKFPDKKSTKQRKSSQRGNNSLLKNADRSALGNGQILVMFLGIGLFIAVVSCIAVPRLMYRSSEFVGLGRMWLISSRQAEFSCPASSCGVLNMLKFGDPVDVVGIKGSWARVSEYHDAQCKARHSREIYEGKDICSADNGITDGRVASWIPIENLSRARPISLP